MEKITTAASVSAAWRGMSDEELEETAEVFALEDGTYLIVEG